VVGWWALGSLAAGDGVVQASAGRRLLAAYSCISWTASLAEPLPGLTSPDATGWAQHKTSECAGSELGANRSGRAEGPCCSAVRGSGVCSGRGGMLGLPCDKPWLGS